MNYPFLIKALESMSELDFEATPAVRVTARLRDNLIAHHFEQTIAEEIACSVEIDLPLEPAEDEIVERLAYLTALTLSKMRAALQSVGFQNPEKSVLICARRFKLSLR